MPALAAFGRLRYGQGHVPRLRPLLILAACLLPAAAWAGEARCWFEAGVVVVPAEVMGVAGDFVFDTGESTTLLAETQAQGAGYAGTELRGRVRVAGLELEDRAVAVAPLDDRLFGLPTPVAGVLGADLLAGKVVDLSFAPCRLGIYEAGRAPRLAGAAASLPLILRGDRAVTTAAVSDGRRAFVGDFVLGTGSDTPVRLRDDLADAPGAVKRDPLYPYGVARPRLRALSFAGDLIEQAPSGLVAKPGFDAAGEIGAPVLAAYRLRFDFLAGRLSLAKQKGPPDRSGGP